MALTRGRKRLTLVFAGVIGLLILVILLGRSVAFIAPIKAYIDRSPWVVILLFVLYWIGHMATRSKEPRS